ncbi:acriflavin resistance protein [Photobacterium angustum]|uniref:AcrB/AcrD/AcrF family protein n=1 Tax=Photobacterium angustum TaxID=661 RepID=A0ABX5H844_PHOAN|nr:efflux RND transporter permease subunit [Photobacterium angustum]KJG38982.1 acriflavin resistance protein [Photobacterium angustum]PSX11636.1 AcrB/AcrD/AcrF family protein [Photobacterium angustum]
MRLPEVCIKHPVFASVLSIAIILIGLFSFQKLAIQYFPDHNSPKATVTANIDGASADFMSRNVATHLINAATGLESVDIMTTDCTQGKCTLNVKFDDGITDVEYANLMNKLRSSIEAIIDFPPSMVDKPTVTDDSGDKGSASNIITFINKGKMSSQEMYDFIGQQIKPQFRHIQGVGGVYGPYGGAAKAVRVWLNPNRMMALNVKAADVVTTLSAYSSSFTVGQIVGEARNFQINPVTQVTSVKDVQDLVIRVDDGNIIRIKDIADVKMGENSLTPSKLKVNGETAMSLQVLPLKSENPVDVAARVKAEITKMQQHLPDGLEMKMVYNQADFIQESIDQGFHTLFEAIVLVSVIVVLFLGSLRIASIPIITIPVCIIGVFAVMSFLGFSINVLTILAIILAIGLVVDDAIVVVENCYRYIEEGETPLNAAIKGSNEIIFPVIAMTMTLAAVYLPIGLMSGMTADLFRQFAFTLAASVIISGMVALTLSPMMCAYLIKPVAQQPRWFAAIDKQIHKLSLGYTKQLSKWFDRKALMGGIALALIALSGVAVWYMPQVLLPTEDTGFIDGTSEAPTGVGRRYHIKHNSELNTVMGDNKDIAANLSYIEATPSNHILLEPWGKRTKPADEIVAELTEKAAKTLSAYSMSFSVRSADGLNAATNLKLQLKTVNRDNTKLNDTANRIVKKLSEYDGLTRVKSSLLRDQLRYDLRIDRNAIILSGVAYTDVTNALSTFLGSLKAANLQADDGYTYPIRVQVNRKDLGNFDIIDKLYVASESGQNIPLSEFVSIKAVTSESSFKTYMGQNSAEITATLMPGYTAGDVRDYIDENVPELLDDSQSYAYDGVVKELMDSQDGTQTLFLMALIFIYLILAAQFESFVDPLIILLTVPLCIVGAVLTLWVFGQSLNIYSQIGLLTLVGLVTKHGILLVEFANEQRKHGKTAIEAAIHSARSRLRPILMTSLTMILGALPLAFASGPGSLGRVNIGLVLVGGLTAGTFFSLFLVPVAYVGMSKLREKDVLKTILSGRGFRQRKQH